MSHPTLGFGGMPPGIQVAFAFDLLPDGALRVVKAAKAHRYKLGPSLLSVLFFGGLAWFTLLGPFPEFWLYKLQRMLEPSSLLSLLFGVLFAGISVWLLTDLLWKALGREEWRISHNRFEWRGNFLGIRWVRRYQDSKVWLRAMGTPGRTEDEPAAKAVPPTSYGESYLQIAKRDSKFWHQRHLYQSKNPEELLALGKLLAQRLGWPLEQDPEFANRCAPLPSGSLLWDSTGTDPPNTRL